MPQALSARAKLLPGRADGADDARQVVRSVNSPLETRERCAPGACEDCGSAREAGLGVESLRVVWIVVAGVG